MAPYNIDREQVLCAIDDWIGRFEPRQMILVTREYVSQVVKRHAG